MSQKTNLWFTKSRRAQNVDDYETWIEGDVAPTLNAFDNGDIRTTVLVLRMREGKPGGGKGPMIGEDRSFTIATSNDQVVFAIQGTMIGRQDHNGPGGPGFTEKGPMYTLTSTDTHAVAYDEFNDSIADTHHTLRSGTKQSTGVVMESTVRRLTPLECERLQGFPDGWTEGQSDSNRYKQMGNAVAVPVVEWIIGNITAIV